jgi:hypothetical protein
MKTFERIAAQGDFIIMKISELPETLVPMQPRGSHYVIAHSETGHDHVMLMDRVKAYTKPDIQDKDLYELFLSVEAPAEIEHMRSFDTHETLLVPPGNYIVKRQREYVPEGFRRAAD